MHNTRVEKNRTIPQFGRSDERRVVSLGSPAACRFVDLAAHVLPIRLGMSMPVQNRKHEMDKANIACLRLNQKTRCQMPAGMSVVTFPALANLDRRFDLQPDQLATFLR